MLLSNYNMILKGDKEMIIKLSSPYVFEGKEYTEFSLDLDKLTGGDIIAAGVEARSLGQDNLVAELSKSNLAAVAARAATVPVDMILGLSAKDFTGVTVAVQNFLLG